MVRIGIGYDIHRLVAGRRLFLGGIKVKSSRGALGHSDGDVLLHAIIDSLLGAAGLGDIGEYFSDRDPRYKNISSRKLLRRTLALLKEQRFRIIHLDSVIIAERPRLSAVKKKIKTSLARQLGLGEGSVNVKAKTHEGLGALGRAEAIAAFASALVEG